MGKEVVVLKRLCSCDPVFPIRSLHNAVLHNNTSPNPRTGLTYNLQQQNLLIDKQKTNEPNSLNALANITKHNA